MVSLADVGVLTGLKRVLRRRRSGCGRDAVERKMYVTGGVGTTGNEGFGEPYALPNISAYAETCAVLMFMTLNHRLFMATGDGKYIDVHGARHVQQRRRRRLVVGQPLLLRQPAGERRRRPRRALGARVARVLPAEPRPVPGLDARLHLRAGPEGRDLRQPLRLERDALRRRRQADRR